MRELRVGRWTPSPPTTSTAWSAAAAARPDARCSCGRATGSTPSSPAPSAGPSSPRRPEHDGLKTMASWLRGHCRLSPARGRPAGAQRPRAGAPAGGGRGVRRRCGHRRAGGGDRPGHHGREPGRRRRAGRRPGRDRRRRWPRSPPPGRTTSWARSCTTTWPGWTPTAPNPTPPRAGRCRIATHADGSGHRPRSNSTPSAGRRSQAVAGVDRAGQPARRGHPHPRPAARRRARAVGRQRPRRRRAADPAHRQAARGRHHPARRPGRPRTPAPARPSTGFGARDLRRPRPLAGLRRQRHPHRHRPRRAAAGRGPHATGSSHRTCAGRSRSATGTASSPAATPRTYWCDVHHLLHWIDDGETSTGELRAALRTPPHQGPPRLPDRTTTRRPMAHLAPRRHRDPPAPPPARRLSDASRVQSSQGRTVSSGHCCCHRAALVS